MKKTLLLLYGFLIVLFVGMHVLNHKNTYSAERRIWKLTRQYSAIVKNYEGTPVSKYEDLQKRFSRFIATYSPHRITAAAHVMRARLFGIQEKHAEAQQELNSALGTFKDNEAVAIQLSLERAQMYANQQDTQGVYDTYKQIIDNYPLSKYGLQGPLILAKYFVEQRDAVKAKQAYQEGIEHYKQLIEKHPETQVEFQSRILLAESYSSLEDWDKTLQMLEETLLKFANPKFWNRNSFLHVTQSINSLTILREQDYETPARIYTTFIEQHPDHPFNRDLGLIVKMIGDMQNAQKAKAEKDSGLTAPQDISIPEIAQ